MPCKWRHPVVRRSPGRVEVVTLSARICGRLPRRRRGSRRHRYEVRAFSRRYHEKRRSGVSTYRSDITATVHRWCTVGSRKFVNRQKKRKDERKRRRKKRDRARFYRAVQCEKCSRRRLLLPLVCACTCVCHSKST